MREYNCPTFPMSMLPATRFSALLTRFVLHFSSMSILQISATKPTWTPGASASISLGPRTSVSAAGAGKAASAGPKKWVLSSDALTNTSELEDEDALLSRERDAVIVAPKPASDCGTGGAGAAKKACKDCSCGLAQELVDGVASDAPKSACGSVRPRLASSGPRANCHIRAQPMFCAPRC